MSVNKSIIPKINVFNTGAPGFIPEILRKSIPKIYLEKNIIIHKGDKSDSMFFIRMGEVEVLAEDDNTIISILSEGTYFGEIGILL